MDINVFEQQFLVSKGYLIFIVGLKSLLCTGMWIIFKFLFWCREIKKKCSLHVVKRLLFMMSIPEFNKDNYDTFYAHQIVVYLILASKVKIIRIKKKSLNGITDKNCH